MSFDDDRRRRRATAACARPGGQRDHHRMVAHVVRHEMKTRPKLLGRLFFDAKYIMRIKSCVLIGFKSL